MSPGAAALVIGASGGIGRALVDALSATGEFATVHAASRSGLDLAGSSRSHRADLTDERSLEALAQSLRDAPLRLVIVASGLLHDDRVAPEKSMRALDGEALARVFAVNAIGPALAAKHLLPLMPRDQRFVFAALSARVGSISDNRLGGWYGYRASKAALNQILRTLAIETARTKPQGIVLGLHPGTVATELSAPYRGEGDGGVFTAAEAASHLLRVIAGADPSQSGRVLAWDGTEVPP